MQNKRILLAASFMLSALLILSIQSLAKPETPDGAALAALVEDGEVRQIDLGDGRHMAVIPASSGSELNATFTGNPTIDTYVDSYTGLGYCSDSELHVSYSYAPDSPPRQPGGLQSLDEVFERSFLGFNLSSIPSDAVVSSATFYAYLKPRAQGNSFIAIRRVTASWNCSQGWPGPASASYTGKSVGTDAGWKSWTVTSLVRNYWLGKNFGTSPNYGLEMRGQESGGLSYYH